MVHVSIERLLILPAVVAGFVATGCGGSESEDGSTGGSGGEKGCADCRRPPAPPETGVPAEGDPSVFAMSRLFLGDVLRSGEADPDAWKQFGYDLDGVKSTMNTTQHCQPLEGATAASVKTDGEGGIDNSFGANVLPIFEGIEPDISASINENINGGRYTMLLEIDRLGGASDYLGLAAALYFGARLDSEPRWDGTDEWPLYCELMHDCAPSGTKQIADGNTSIVAFPFSYVSSGTWVSGAKTSATVALTVRGIPLRVDVGEAVMTVELDGSDPPAGGTNGVMAGIIDTTHLIGTLAQLAGRLSTSLCDSATLETLKRNLKAASDIMKDGTQDPDAGCNGISVGIGFEMKLARLGEVQDALESEPDPCQER